MKDLILKKITEIYPSYTIIDGWEDTKIIKTNIKSCFEDEIDLYLYQREYKLCIGDGLQIYNMLISKYYDEENFMNKYILKDLYDISS